MVHRTGNQEVTPQELRAAGKRHNKERDAEMTTATNLLTGQIEDIRESVSSDGIRQFRGVNNPDIWWPETVISQDNGVNENMIGYALWAVSEETEDDDPYARLVASSMFPDIGEIQQDEILVLAASQSKALELARLVRSGGRSSGRIPSSENSPSRYPEWECRPYGLNWFGRAVNTYVPPALASGLQK